MKVSQRKKTAAREGVNDVGSRGVITEPTWRLLAVVILLVGSLLRLYALELKPLHHDEGVNGFFLRRLANEKIYHYDPANYHAPRFPMWHWSVRSCWG